MVSKGLRAFLPIKLQKILERVTTLRKPLKPLLTIPRVSGLLFILYSFHLSLSEIQ
jgi:hypothetical protein